MKGFDRDLGYCLALIFGLGMLLVIFRKPIEEGFESVPNCNLDNPCPGHLKCINGFCANTEPIGIVEKEEVPMLAPGSPAPYF